MKVHFDFEVEPQEMQSLLQAGMATQQTGTVIDLFNQLSRKLNNISYNLNKKNYSCEKAQTNYKEVLR